MNIPEPATFPAELRKLRQWFCARFERDTEGVVRKVPVNVRGFAIDATKPNGDWTDFQTAYAAAPRFDGLGFAIRAPHTFIDIDRCRDPKTGEIEPWAREIIGLFPRAYIEVSQSGTGIHIITCGKWPEDVGHFAYHVPGASHPKAHVEAYSDRRYCAMTGHLFDDLCPEIADGSEGLAALAEQFSWETESKAATGKLLGLLIPIGVNLQKELEARLALKIVRGATTFYNYHGMTGKNGQRQPCLLAGEVHGDNKGNKRCSAFAERDGYFWHSCFADDPKPDGQKGLENCGPEDFLSKTRTAILALDERSNGMPPLFERLCGRAAPGTVTPNIEPAPVDAIATADMPESVLDGRLGEICHKRLLQHSPVAYAWPTLAAIAGVLAHQSSYLRTNLFVGTVGEVESGKSATVDNAIAALGLPEDTPELERSMAGSAEGLLKKIGDAGGCARLYAPDELAHLFAKLQIENASFAMVLQRCY